MSRAFRLLFLCLALLGVPQTGIAAEFGELVERLGSDSFSDKEQAVSALGALGDGRAILALKALSEGSLYTTADKKTVIAEPTETGFRIFDPIEHTARGQVAADAIDKVRVNNRLRGTIAAALAQLTLFSAKPEERLAAAQEALKRPNPDGAHTLETAIQRESDPAIRQALGLALSATRLVGGTKGERIAAIHELTAWLDPQIRSLFDELRNTANLDPEVRRALDAALRSVEFRLKLVGIAETIFQGLSLGSVLLLAAVGLAITFGVMGVINMAHGEMIMLGAYTTFVVQQLFRTFLPAQWFDAYLLASVPVAFLVAGTVGAALEQSIIRFLYGRPLETMLATWGVSLFLQQLVRSIFGAPNKEVANPSWMTGGVDVMGATITWNRVVILIFCFVVLGGLVLVLRRTTLGLHMRAVTQNRAMASAMGIPTATVDALTFGLGSGIAGIAGVALSQIGNVSPNLGTIYIVDSFLVVVFGGVGNLLGTLVGAMSLGIVNKLLEPLAGAVLGKIGVLLFIILFIQKRPRGLFALKGRTAEG